MNKPKKSPLPIFGATLAGVVSIFGIIAFFSGEGIWILDPLTGAVIALAAIGIAIGLTLLYFENYLVAAIFTTVFLFFAWKQAKANELLFWKKKPSIAKSVQWADIFWLIFSKLPT